MRDSAANYSALRDIHAVRMLVVWSHGIFLYSSIFLFLFFLFLLTYALRVSLRGTPSIVPREPTGRMIRRACYVCAYKGIYIHISKSASERQVCSRREHREVGIGIYNPGLVIQGRFRHPVCTHASERVRARVHTCMNRGE